MDLGEGGEHRLLEVDVGLGVHGNVPALVLIDSGASHNFLSAERPKHYSYS